MLLELAGVSKRFGAVVAADNVDLAVAEGEALGIIGANGAGKSSLFNLVTGVLAPDSGTVRLDGRDITRDPVRARCQAGIGRSFQIPPPVREPLGLREPAGRRAVRQARAAAASPTAPRCWSAPGSPRRRTPWPAS